MARLTDLPLELIRLIVEYSCGTTMATVLGGKELSFLQQRALKILIQCQNVIGVVANEIYWAVSRVESSQVKSSCIASARLPA